MYNLINIKDFETFIDYKEINESLTDGSQNIVNQVFLDSGIITFSNGDTVSPREIVNAVEEAIRFLSDEFTRTFQFAKHVNIIYLRKSSEISTMAVDAHMNLYINAEFVYNTLQMNKYYIAAIIMHEVFHILFNHIERGKNWLAAKGKLLNNQTSHDNNLAADIEVNQTLVRLGITDENTISNIIHGLYLKNTGGDLGLNTNVVPMETILENEKYMEKLRSMCPSPVDPTKPNKQEIKTSEEWDKGYKDGWNKIAKLINKYGYKEAWNRLVKAGIVIGTGEINVEKNIDDIMALEFLQVKKQNDLLDESFENIKQSDQYQTYDAGFATAINKLINQLHNAIEQSEDGDSMDREKDNENSIETGIDEKELESVNIPSKGKKSKSKGGKGLPGNINSDSDENDEQENQDEEEEQDDNNSGGNGDDKKSNDGKKNNSKDNQSGKTSGKGGDEKSDSQLTDADYNKLADDINENGVNIDSDSIGGTGSFIENDDKIKKILEESGYDQEAIDEINKIRERNKERNSPKGIQKAREEMRNRMSGGIVKKYLDAIEVSSEKYKNVWKKIMEDFLAKKTRRAGTKINDISINWKKKTRIALGNVGPQYQKVDQDPQDVNVYVDVSGSVDMKLLEIICQSLVIFTQDYEYSGINICPWASTSNGIHKVEDFIDRDSAEISKEILGIVSKGIAQCGGGTESKAVIASMVDTVVYNLENEDKEQKDDVHVVITDGYFDFDNIENKISGAVRSAIKRNDVAQLVPEHTFWMIYDAPEELKDKWKDEINKGKLIFINSETVKANK